LQQFILLCAHLDGGFSFLFEAAHDDALFLLSSSFFFLSLYACKCVCVCVCVSVCVCVTRV